MEFNCFAKNNLIKISTLQEIKSLASLGDNNDMLLFLDLIEIKIKHTK